MVTEEQIQEVIDKSDMVEIVGEFVQLERNGANYKGLCPFHNENTPSFVVSPTKKLATCFGCNKTLDPIGFVKEIKNISFVEALAYVAKKAGVKVDLTINNTNKPNYSKYYKIMENAQSFYTKNLNETKSGQAALDYLHKRGLDDETIKVFGIGLASAEADIVYKILNDLHVSTLDMIDTGLVKSNGNNYYDLFTKRIMFPLKDVDGNILGFSGRIYNTEDKNQPKYVNSPETIIFKKHLNLFNLHNAIPEIRKKHRVILHEGQMDVIASYRAGFKEAVCSLGTALTKEQCQLIKRYTNDVVICYDADNAGINASLRAISILKSQGLNVKLVLMSGAKDPDEYILKYGIDKYVDFINNSIVSEVEFKFLAITHNKDFNDTSTLESVKNQVFEMLAKERSQTLVERFLTRLSDMVHISYSSLMVDYSSYSNIRPMPNYVERGYDSQFNKNSYNNALALMSKYSLSELRLFKYATLDKKKAMYIDSKINIGCFEPLHQSLWMQLIDTYYGFCDVFDEDKFLSLISANSEYFKTYTTDINSLSNTIDIDYSDDDLELCINVFNEYSLVKEINAIDIRIANESDQNIKINLIQQKFNLLKIKNSKGK